jgi:hypothetical protein
MPKAAPRQMWRNDVTLTVEELTFAAQYEEGKGSAPRILRDTGWLDADGKTLLLDVGKRLKGWMKEQARTLGGETKSDAIRMGLSIQSLPAPGLVRLPATVADFRPSRSWDHFQKREQYKLNGFPAPEVEVISAIDGSPRFALSYTLGKSVDISARIFCFVPSLDWERVENWLTVLGQVKGLGDRHNDSAAYGRFAVKHADKPVSVEIKY